MLKKSFTRMPGHMHDKSAECRENRYEKSSNLTSSNEFSVTSK